MSSNPVPMRRTKREVAPTETDRVLTAQAMSLARAVAKADGSGDRAGALTRLFTAAHELVTETSGEVAAELVNGVLGPLAQAITGKRPRQPASAARPSASAWLDEIQLQSLRFDRKLWALTLKVSRVRARWCRNGTQGTLLMHATATLQHLAVTLAPTESRDERLAALRALQAGLPQEIRAAHDGPYLVTNPGHVRDWLGQELATWPQMALCRCGASSTKPVCDGACASSGFTDKKDPNRVQDRRDTYDGVQLTVYDNRGICQHSGFCTDRLNTVFHTEGAFVTPSGGRIGDIIRAVRNCPSGALSYAIDGVEARGQVDWDATRQPAIEVTKDGPYRVTGAIPITDSAGEPVMRAEGSSSEHYALCRCGHSQNKPFCSGMHWYVEFKDPVPDPVATPTLFEWCGGLPALMTTIRIFYEKHVPADPLLAPLFANMSPDHPERVARWLAEVFEGPKLYSETYGGYDRMISQHLGKTLTEAQRARWVELICRSATEAGLPADPEFQAAFRAYIEWGSRIALENSQPGAEPPPHMPVPRWWWVCDAIPGARVSAVEAHVSVPTATIKLPSATEQVGFEQHIKPLFRERDRASMKFAFDLWSFQDVSSNAQAILQRIKAGTMPCDGAWPAAWVEVFERWANTGMSA